MLNKLINLFKKEKKESFRKLAVIRKVDSISDITWKEGDVIKSADTVQLASIGGWQSVVGKGEFKPGDLGIYIEPDSFVPKGRSEFAILEKNSLKEFKLEVTKNSFTVIRSGFRMKHMTFMKKFIYVDGVPTGVLSQGFFCPVFKDIPNPVEGMDVTDILGIEKYEDVCEWFEKEKLRLKEDNKVWYKKWLWRIKTAIFPKQTLVFPSDVPQTDQERIQNLKQYIYKYIDMVWEMTEKLEGQSNQVTLHKATTWLSRLSGKMEAWVLMRTTVAGKGTRNRMYFQNTEYFKLVEKFPNYSIQGEFYGEGVQADYYDLKKNHFRIYNIWDKKERRYLLPDEVTKFINENINSGVELNYVPVIRYTTIRELVEGVGLPVEELLELTRKPLTEQEEIIKNEDLSLKLKAILKVADRKSLINPLMEAEGIVFKSMTQDGLSFKAISNKYELLKEERENKSKKEKKK